MEAYLNADIYVPDGVLHDHALVVDEALIVGIVHEAEVPPSASKIDLQGKNVAAGFVDLQVNGGGGVLFNTDCGKDAVIAAVRAHQRLGTTSIFPTVFTSSFDAMAGLLETLTELRAAGAPGIAGIHFEGPVIDAGKAGVHDVNHIEELDRRMLDLFVGAASIMPTLVTLAPEKVSDAGIEELRSGGVLVFAGHTNANYERMESAFAAGLQGGTHLFNAMSAFTSRAPGVAGALLADERAYASIIVDGFHVHWASVRAAWRAMNPGHLFAVTDAMPCVGSDVGEFDLASLHILVRNGRCETADGTLAGSALDMGTAVRNLVQKVGVPLPEALRMANRYPCDFAGIRDLGRLEARCRADFVVFDNQLRERVVFVAGKRLE